MEELASCPAFIVLDQQVADGKLDKSRALAFKLRYAELHRAAVNAVEREKDCIAKARELRAQVRDDQIGLEKARIRKEQLESQTEAADVHRKKLQGEVAALESREGLMQAELADLAGRERELVADVARLKKANETTVSPLLAAAMTELAEARGALARATSQAESLTATKAEMQRRLDDTLAQAGASASAASALKAELVKARAEPPRANKQVESVRRALAEAKEAAAVLRADVGVKDTELSAHASALAEIHGVRKALDAKLTAYRADIDAREAEVTAAEKALQSEKAQHRQLLERRMDCQADADAAAGDVRLAEAQRAATLGAYERAKRELKRKLDSLNEAMTATPQTEAQLSDRVVELTSLRAAGTELEAQLAAAKRDMDALIAGVLKEEGVERKQRAALEDAQAACETSEQEKDLWRREEVVALKQVASLKAQRDLQSRELARAVAQRKVAIEQSQMKELQLLDLTKQLADVNSRLNNLSKMYELVKNERNATANAIQTASQSIAEMRERIKILHKEIDILNNETASKERALAKQKAAQATAVAQRDALLVETNKTSAVYRERQAVVETHIVIIDNLSGIINTLEREMIALKRRYERAVEARNAAGIQLIDRNDELCILYEKSNILSKTAGEGEKELAVVNEEIRALKIAVADLERSLHLARSKFPEMPALAEQILELQKNLVVARRVTEKLCADLESPGTAERWHDLDADDRVAKTGGERDPTVDELKTRVQDLEDRLNSFREELLDKELVLGEISALSDRLAEAAAGGLGGLSDAVNAASRGIIEADGVGAQAPDVAAAAAGGDAPGLATAKALNDVQARLREVTRRLMAVVSELSMYQATAIKLAAETRSAQSALDAAAAASAAGHPPSAAAERRWQALRQSLEAAASGTGQAMDASPSFTEPDAKTTAEQRPNAYIPAGAGIPKPYGEFAPLRPTEPGTNMRHFRPPASKILEAANTSPPV